MAIQYNPPDDLTVDTFNVPSSPQSTPLSQAGTAKRDHPELHADVGTAVERLQQWASISTHNHSGATDPSSGPQLIQANTHQDADTNSSTSALHHTLGPTVIGGFTSSGSAFQAAPGNHTHIYDSLQQIPLEICTSNSRPGTPTVGEQVYETDTNRVRVWAAFKDNAAMAGLNYTDTFDQANTQSMGPNWQQAYDINPSSANAGVMATPQGNSLSWTPGGHASNWCIAQRIDPSNAQTVTDDQIVSYQTGQNFMQYEPFAGYTSNDVYLRMSADMQSYVRFAVAVNFVTLYYTRQGPAAEVQLGQFGWPLQPATQTDTTITSSSGGLLTQVWDWMVHVEQTVVNDVIKVAEYLGAAPPAGTNPPGSNSSTMTTIMTGSILTFTASGQSFEAAINGQTVATFTDGAGLTAYGSSNRGWGIGMHAPKAILSGQLTPANVTSVSVSDLSRYTSIQQWSLLTSAEVPVVILEQQNTQQQISTAGTPIRWDTVVEDNFGFTNSGSPTTIRIGESGVYDINVAVQWDPTTVPTAGGVRVVLNNQSTSIQAVQTLRFNLGLAPGYSQTVAASGRIRLTAGDIISVDAFFQGSTGLNDFYTFVGLDNSIVSRCSIAYTSP